VTFRVCHASIALVTLLGWRGVSLEQAGAPVGIQNVGTESSAILGIVATDATGATPVGRALVSLIKLDDQARFAAVTDDEGKFAIRAIPAGRYTLEAEKPGYLTNSYGARRAGMPGITLPVRAGQHLDRLLVVLPLGAVISGRLTLGSGIPLRETEVVAIPTARQAAEPRGTLSRDRFFSDDQGNYRIWGLAGGEYFVVALPEFSTGEVQRRTPEDFDAIARALTTGVGNVASGVGVPAAASGKRDRAGYGPTFYPSTPVATLATTIRVKAGDVIGGADLTIAPFRISTVAGSVIDSNGQPVEQAWVNVEAVGPTLTARVATRRLPVRTDSSGLFEILDLPPGTYRVMATGVQSTPPGGDGEGKTRSTWAATTVDVVNVDVVNLALVLQPSRTLSGRVVLEQPVVPAAVTETRVTLVSLEAGRSSNPLPPPFGGDLSRRATVESDGSFVVHDIRPGNYELKVDLASLKGPERHVRSIEVQGRDLRDAPLTFQDGSIAGVTVTLTTKATGVSGTLLAADGLPTSDYFVVLFPAHSSLWHPASPRIQVTRSAADGRYQFKGIPAGEYRIAAVTGLEDVEWRQAVFLASLVELSLAVEVREAAMVDLSVRVR
jgi:hypothetical protein